MATIFVREKKICPSNIDSSINGLTMGYTRFHPREWSGLSPLVPPAFGTSIGAYKSGGAARSRKKDGGGERPSKRIFISGVIYTRHFRIRRTEFDASALRFKRGPRCPVYNSKAEFIDWRGR